MEQDRTLGAPGYIAAFFIGGGEFGVMLCVSVALFIGLLRMRKELR
jgi:hypothetical protein